MMGEGPFEAGVIATGLLLRPDPENVHHGFVEPEQTMALDEYRGALEATRDAWSVAPE
jgi:hypothetical protein